jgi:hypothetical protein
MPKWKKVHVSRHCRVIRQPTFKPDILHTTHSKQIAVFNWLPASRGESSCHLHPHWLDPANWLPDLNWAWCPHAFTRPIASYVDIFLLPHWPPAATMYSSQLGSTCSQESPRAALGKKISWDVGVRVEIISRNQSTCRWGLSDLNLPSAIFNMPWSVGQWVCVFTSLVIIISMHRVC